ncbi:MAG: four helix bundle protein [Candidatus Cloacimonetes bacterium]|nr:four helix bundle protein [Candidatus Cloacimonadota bacterium]MBL7086670.1 four helix bundle protein [Candidatus Cloacimonadota bacterium]
MSKFNSIEEIEIWKDACELAIEIYQITNTPKLKFDFSLKDQLRRSAVSISSNIAEGFERETNKEFIRFLYIAKGSCGELRSQIYIAFRIGYIEEKIYISLLDKCKILSRKIQKLITYLKNHLD